MLPRELFHEAAFTVYTAPAHRQGVGPARHVIEPQYIYK